MATREQIEETYNYMDELFRLTYGEHGDCSGAMYDGDFTLSLEEAQGAKHRYILENLRISAGTRVLDIGCGWGPVLQVATRCGAQGIGLTLSTKQAEACRRNGLEVYVRDWREVGPETFGQFDAAVSVGSFEHFCSDIEFREGKQDEVYSRFMKFCHDVLRPGGRLFLQTMIWGKNAPRPEDVSLKAPKASNEYVVALLQMFYPGSWLPSGQEQIERCAAPYFRLVSAKNGRLDYIETMNQWGRNSKFSFPKLLAAIKTLRYFFLDKDLYYKVKSLALNCNQECFKREIFDHQRMVFERVLLPP
jgi:cyclopropane-fatty-acyl-phospholipid synthase